MIKKKLCCILAEGSILMGLCCACAGCQNAEITEKQLESTPIETAASDAAEIKTDVESDIETDVETDVEIDATADAAVAPDLNRNGIPEEVRLTALEDGQGQQLEIWEKDELIDREVGGLDRKSVV